MKNNFFKKALSVFTAMAMALSLMTGIPFSELGLGITANAASASTPVVSGKFIYAHGTPITIEAGSSSSTASVWYMNGSTKTYVAENVSGAVIYGGCDGESLDSDTNITMTGGSVSAIYGGGLNNNDASKSYVNNVNISISGGTVSIGVFASNQNWVKGNVNITVTGGNISRVHGCTASTQSGAGGNQEYCKVSGNASVTITGGTVGALKIGDGYSPVDGVTTGIVTIPGVTLETNSYTATNDYDNLYINDGTTFMVKGDVTLPENTKLIIPSGETLSLNNSTTIEAPYGIENNGTLNIESGCTDTYNIENNGTLNISTLYTNSKGIVNNGTINLTKPILGDKPTGNGTINRNTAYISGISSVSSISVKMDDADYALANGYYETADGKLYLWLPSGYAVVFVDGSVYCGTANEGTAVELLAYKAVADIETVSSRIPVGINYNLSTYAVTNNDASYKTIEWSVVSANGTGATITDNAIKATATGTATIRATVNNGQAYGTAYTKDYEVTFYVTDDIDISMGSITISKKDDTTITVAGTGIPNGSKDYPIDESIRIIGSTTTSNTITVKSGATANVILNGVEIDCSNTGITPIMVESDATLNLTLIGDNVLTACTLDDGTDAQKTAALGVPMGAELVITENSTGTLTANGAKGGGAGIGGGYNSSAGTITINGGTINATSDNGAGIGGGYDKSGDRVTRNGGIITINGGTINATSDNGAGIGSSYYGDGGTVIINDGTVNATSDNGAGIGAGYYSRSNCNNYVTVTIEGGTVNATSTYGAGIGGGTGDFSVTVTINGGTINATSTYGAGIGRGYDTWYYDLTVTITGGNFNYSSVTAPTNGSNEVSCYTCKFIGDSEDMAGKTVTAITLENGGTYGLKDVVTFDGGSENEGYFNCYLPAGSKITSITVGGTTYNCRAEDGTCYVEHTWEDATCTIAEHCIVCDKTQGELRSHNYVDGVCTTCSMDRYGTFHIKTADQLVAFAQYVALGNKDANAELDANIVMTDVDWTPICQTVSFHDTAATDTGYTGTFDGNGHTISNLTVTGIAGATYSYGLFGTVSGTVENLGMVNYIYTMGSASDARAGSIAGQVLTGGTITNCYSVGHTVTTNNNIAGGIAGCTYGGTISNCYALKLNGSVSGYDTRWGGVVGDCQKDSTAPDLAQTYGTVSNCYTDDTRVVSSQSENANIENCALEEDTAFASGKVAYLLNGGKTDGTQSWYQNLSDDNNKDSYPVLNDTHGIVYSVCKCNGETPAGYYSNVNENEPHTDVNPVDNVCDVCSANLHTHEWEYTVNGDTITAVCGAADCPATGTNTIVIYASGKTYDGTAVTATVTNNVDTTDYSSSIVYKNDDDVVTEAVNAGTYTANLTLTNADSTKATASVEFTIDEKAITVTADNKSKTYGEGDTELTYTITDGTLVNGETLTGTLVRAEGEDVGTYAITQGTLTNENNPNYDITFVDGIFTINGVDISGATAVQNGTLTYDGTAQTPTFTVTLGNATLTADDYDVTVTAQTNAGSYTATIAGKGNCSGTIADVAWEILPANIADTSITYAPLTYNGMEQTPVFTIKLGDYTLNASDYSVTVTAQINAGDYTATIVGNLNFDGNIDVDWSIGKKAADEVTSPTAATITYGQTLSEATLTSGWSWVNGTVIPTVINNGYAAEITVDDSNYDYTSIDGYNADTHKITRTIAVTVEKAAPTITTEPYAAAGLVYDGSAKVLVNEGAVTGGSFVYSLTGNNFTATLPTATEAKEYTVYWRVAGDENHNNSETFNFKVTIAKATPPALTTPTATAITYGEKLSASTLSDSSWAWVDGTVIPTVANNGFEANIEVDDSNYDYTDVDGYNETVHTVTRTIAVTVNRAELTVTAESYTVKLGNPLPETLEYEVTGLIGNDTIDSIGANVAIGYESGVTPSAVGDYTIVVSGEAETDNYTITYENGKLIITEKNVQTITASDVTLTYGDTAKINATTNGDGTISYTVATGTDVITVAADGTVTPLKAGTATVTITAADTADYAVATKTVTVTVNKKKIAIPAADTKEYTYTGTAQTYGVASTDDYTVTGGVQTNAGNYPITIALKDENYEWDGTLGTYTFVIKQANVTITAKSYTIKVGEALPTFEYDVTGLVNGETLPIDVTISCSATNSETEGNYPITVTGVADSTNYKFTYVNGTLTVSAKEEQTITASNVTTTYGDTAKINATTNGNGAISYAVATGTDVITVAADGTVTPLKAGTATVTITAAETDTYAQATKTVTITVNKATVTITAKDYTIYIGEDVPAFEYTATGLVNGETLPITPVITCDVTDTSKTGTYDIIVTGDAESDNYKFAYVNGTLTVKRKSTGGGGGGGGYTPSRPSTPTNPEIGGKAKTWTDIATELNGMANGSETTIELNGNYDVPVDVIKAIAEKDLKVTFIVDTNRSWYVDGADITNPVAADLSVTTTIRVDSSSLRGIEGYEFSIDGTSLPTEFAYSFAKRNAGKFANLYIKTDDGFVFVDNVKLDENGLAKELDLSVKGQYVIMVCEFSDRMGDSNNDGVLNAMDASAILRDIVELEKAANPEMADYNGDGRTNALDASEILKVIVGLIPDKYEFKAENN